MIRVEQITIEEFRGIRKLTLNLNGKNYAVCGPNGTGKSGVVDALEFGLTGNISRLSGGGTGGISLKKHAPHVDSRDFPERAKVTLVLSVPSLSNRKVTIERNVQDSRNPVITPDSPEVREVLAQLENHPEFVLSRRELIAYVLAQPGKRSDEIQALLRLDKIGDLRSTLKSLSNTTEREAKALKRVSNEASEQLAKALEIPELKQEKLLAAVNAQRAVLELPSIETLTSTTALNDGLRTGSKGKASSKINKTEALADLKTTRDTITSLGSTKTATDCEGLHSRITDLSADPTAAESVSREKFLQTAISLINDDATCPVCDTEWDIDTLREHVGAKLKKFQEATETREQLEKELEPVIADLEKLGTAVAALERHSKVLAPEQTPSLTSFRTTVAARVAALKSFVPFTDTLSSLGNIGQVPKDVAAAIDTVESAVAAIPDPSKQEAARDFLILCQSRLETYRDAAREATRAREHADLALTVHDVYVEESSKVLEGVYEQVQDEFSEFYRFINSDDEGAFTAKLIPSIGKLSFDVDFYGRGHFPPGAYHSEGHQDGMGLCLYLALMQRLQNDSFTFAVLDDVLMSVDVNHRREVCRLLKKYFGETQFVLTTHDDVWLKYMQQEGLIDTGNSKRFSDWNPEVGPTEWDKRDVWAEIDESLAKGDVQSASHTLRYYLEYVFKEVCHNLRANVEYHGDGRYDLGDVLPPAVKRYREFILKGKNAAESWGRTEDAEALQEREKMIAESFQACNAEQWHINAAVHYNTWANLSTKEFKTVAETFRNLVEKFFCEKAECKGLYYLVGTTPKDPETLKCTCGTTSIDLKKKPTSPPEAAS